MSHVSIRWSQLWDIMVLFTVFTKNFICTRHLNTASCSSYHHHCHHPSLPLLSKNEVRIYNKSWALEELGSTNSELFCLCPSAINCKVLSICEILFDLWKSTKNNKITDRPISVCQFVVTLVGLLVCEKPTFLNICFSSTVNNRPKTDQNVLQSKLVEWQCKEKLHKNCETVKYSGTLPNSFLEKQFYTRCKQCHV